jgi:outer membrane receptor for ferrienterochelin and colicins
LNSSLSYHWKKTNTTFSAYYKFNGRQLQFVAAFDDNGNPTFRPSILDSFSLMDASVRKLFYNNSFEVTAGARNIFNIVTVNQSQPNAGAVHQADVAQLLGYGRSYFLKLVYNLNL